MAPVAARAAGRTIVRPHAGWSLREPSSRINQQLVELLSLLPDHTQVSHSRYRRQLGHKGRFRSRRSRQVSHQQNLPCPCCIAAGCFLQSDPRDKHSENWPMATTIEVFFVGAVDCLLRSFCFQTRSHFGIRLKCRRVAGEERLGRIANSHLPYQN